MRIKSRKEREKEYAELYGKVSLDAYERLKDDLGDKFNPDTLQAALDRMEQIRENIEYNTIRFTFYEVPIQAHRPRSNFKTHGLHVPNAKANFDAVKKFLNDLKIQLSIVAVPMKAVLTSYSPMPKNANPVDKILYEAEADYAIGKPDFDNVLKAYCDMIQKLIILDDDIVVSSKFDKYFSYKPRVVLEITFPNGYISEYSYKTITARKSFKELGDQVNAKLLISPYKQRKSKKEK